MALIGAGSMVITALGWGGCGDDGGPNRTYELAGYVTEEQSRSALGGVRVTFRSDTLVTASTTTDDDGFYEIGIESDVPFGQVRAEREGYFPRERTVFFDTPSRRVDLALRAQ